jgi:hypothetical protein
MKDRMVCPSSVLRRPSSVLIRNPKFLQVKDETIS